MSSLGSSQKAVDTPTESRRTTNPRPGLQHLIATIASAKSPISCGSTRDVPKAITSAIGPAQKRS